MSQHADITKECLSKAVKFNLSHAQAAELLNSILNALEYEEEFAELEIPSLAFSYLSAQRDGLYGVSHSQINEWVKKTV